MTICIEKAEQDELLDISPAPSDDTLDDTSDFKQPSNNLSAFDGDFKKADHPRGKGGEFAEKNVLTPGNNSGSILSYPKGKIINDAFEKAKKETPNYFELSGRNPNFPQKWKATKFSYPAKLTDHSNRHGPGVDAKSEDEYLTKAKQFLHSPLGKSGDVIVSKNGEIAKYDYETKYFAKAKSNGIIKTYWNLADNMTPKEADEYWEKENKKLGG